VALLPLGKRHGIVAICYVAVTALTERFWQNPTQSEVRPDRRARSVGVID
jgi:hypothetical protein